VTGGRAHRALPALVAVILAGPALTGSTLIGPAATATMAALSAPSRVNAARAVDCLNASPTVQASVPWPQQVLRLDRTRAFSTGVNTVVAIVDSGVDAATPQLAGRVERGIDLLANGGRADNDCLGHGTFIAGIIAAAPTWGIGFAGVAPDTRILPIRATNSQEGDPARFAQGIRAAVDAGAKIINVSASTTDPYPSLIDAAAYAESHDALVIASTAGDSGSTAPVYPAALPTVLAVAAIDSVGAPARFSRSGSYIGLAAPGVDVLSVGPGGPGQLVGSGTSYAAAFVSGVAALVRAYRPGLTAKQVRDRLRQTADHAPQVPDPVLGWGVVDPLAALTTELPEEGPDGGSVAARPKPADIEATIAPHRTGRVLVMLGAGAAILVVGLTGLLAVLGPAGHRRRWRPARVLRVTGASPPPSRE
jgi:membrane-anchored mycosin MYCP